ncbi:MAG: iron-containing alcohol dehydrogenase [Promethearchaeota archaeon]|nr:MAG: iron-containing alcohol dehydrogenase [Candidatus Lokiarchaeota archaeon]
MVIRPKFGNWLSINSLENLDDYYLFTMREPWEIIKEKLSKPPLKVICNPKMDIDHITELAQSTFSLESKAKITIVGMGGGTACDTAKFMSYWLKKEKKIEIELVLIPSIISVDAFLCSSIAVRKEDKVRYIGESDPKEIIIDYNLIQKAPKFLNRAGVSDTISICSALGDWKIAREEIKERFDKSIFNRARMIVLDLMKQREEIKHVSEKGIKALVEGFYQEVELCEEWGNARPEEGSEHFLAYCLESITGKHYIHGNLIGMNVLISLILQEEYAEFSTDTILKFLRDIKIEISPKQQKINLEDLKHALEKIRSYVLREGLSYSIYNSPRLELNDQKIAELLSYVEKL